VTTLEHPHNPEHERSKETIFPLDTDLIAQRMKIFEASSENFLTFVIESRGKWGPATSLYANMPTANLVEWHKQEQDFNQATEIYYRAGLLNGMDIAKAARLQHDPMAVALQANNPQVFTHATEYMKETYRGLDDEAERGWVRQKDRELRYTGSNILLEAAITQYDRLSKHIDNEKYDHTDSDNDSALALYVGMVDGAIFVNAYSAFEHGNDPQIYDAAH